MINSNIMQINILYHIVKEKIIKIIKILSIFKLFTLYLRLHPTWVGSTTKRVIINN